MAESIIYGREREKEEIIKFLFSDANQVSIISIVGLMGKGKTTLTQLVYNDHRIHEQFEFKAWVHVSESFDCLRLIQEILYHQLQHWLAGNKYLLVLDDAWIKNRNMFGAFTTFF
ncbi:putative P-loop containing nucleoside triphosphate hydrolase [Medicago truncatula]|uniref:Putative P-loop containing nucleoside triphosphate hydrolase n=1 Tax=Medicago truncatula TaxID=3880 RepID=A0A396JQK0_MEDTR|nr:putative P-loop containing nucleoside triphosphate hydrolase [Medicago truncatula]